MSVVQSTKCDRCGATSVAGGGASTWLHVTMLHRQPLDFCTSACIAAFFGGGSAGQPARITVGGGGGTGGMAASRTMSGTGGTGGGTQEWVSKDEHIVPLTYSMGPSGAQLLDAMRRFDRSQYVP